MPGDAGEQVKLIQYYLSVLAFFDENLPMPSLNGVFDEKTEQTVREFQAQQGLNIDGIVGRQTWNALLTVYDRTISSIPPQYMVSTDEIYPGKFLALGQSGREVKILQEFLVQAAQNMPEIPAVEVTGNYDAQTEAAIRVVQAMEDLPQNGVTGPLTWNAVVSLAKRSE